MSCLSGLRSGHKGRAIKIKIFIRRFVYKSKLVQARERETTPFLCLIYEAQGTKCSKWREGKKIFTIINVYMRVASDNNVNLCSFFYKKMINTYLAHLKKKMITSYLAYALVRR